MTNLTFYGGVNEIGGNKILVEDGDTRVFFDFGQSFTMGCDYFSGWLNPRGINGLGDYFEFGLLPKLKGLYAQDFLQSTKLPYCEPQFDAIFLSHAHFDHVSHIEFTDPQIPIYLGEGTKLFLEALEKTSSYCNYGEHDYHLFRTGDKLNVGNLEVEPIHVDHSIPAAYGFLIHTSEGSIVYTGDLRVHGPRNDMTQEFADKAGDAEPVAMICEGTRMVEVEHRQNYSEKQVKNLSNKVISKTSNIVFVARYSRDMDRFRSFYELAKKNRRQIVVSPKTAYLLDKLADDRRLDLPDPLQDESILVYYRRKKSGKFADKDYYVWERTFMEKLADHKFIHKHQEHLLMDLDFPQFTELIDIRPRTGSHFIHSMSEPHSEEDIEDRIMHNWLDHFQMQFHQLHASGHMNRQQITDLVNRVNPERVFPIHTENPQLFKKTCDDVSLVNCGKKCKLH
jgi:ribonuclease J